MNNKKYDEELVEIFVKAAGDAFSSLKESHREDFYYYAFIFDEGLQPYISAWSYEALDQSILDNEITDEEEKSWRKTNFLLFLLAAPITEKVEFMKGIKNAKKR